MRLSRKNMSARVDYLDKLIMDTSKRLMSAPDGKLKVSTGNGYKQYLLNEGGGKKKYISKNDMDLIKRIAQKEYDQKVVEVGRSELTTLKALINKYEIAHIFPA